MSVGGIEQRVCSSVWHLHFVAFCIKVIVPVSITPMQVKSGMR